MSEIDFNKMLSLFGRWDVSDDGKITKYTSSGGEEASHGLVLLGRSVDDGCSGL